jgi:hypothetical protein
MPPSFIPAILEASFSVKTNSSGYVKKKAAGHAVLAWTAAAGQVLPQH